MDDIYEQFRNMSVDELVKHLASGQPGSPMAETIRSLVYVRAVQGLTTATSALEQALMTAATSSAKLQRALIWFTAVIALATVAGVLVAVFS